MKKSRIALVTGFAPFAGDALNPSAEIARKLHGEILDGMYVVGAVLPTEFARSLSTLESLIQLHHPAVVVALGLAGGRGEISLERVAINLIDARIADNAGAQPIDEAVIADAPTAYFSSLPLKALLLHLRTLGIPVAISHSAGTFVCNQVFFGLAHLLATRYPAVIGGFVHVPYLPQQARNNGAASMALDMQIAAIRAIVETVLKAHATPFISGGTTH
jgi:pyroglutamyl-peptidase